MEYIAHLSKDNVLKRIIESQQPVSLTTHSNICLRLCASIMSQQLSTKVAEVIFKRFLLLYGGNEPTPEQIIATPFEVVKGIGLSASKTQYVLNVAQFALAHQLNDERLQQMSNDEIIALLTEIKGVGRWTVEMLLMFTLGREDVFAIDDYGIQTTMQKLYALENSHKKKFKDELIGISAKWAPFRTYACIHLWQWKDNK